MLEKIKELAAPFKGHFLLGVIWGISTLALMAFIFYVPILIGGLLVDIFGIKSLADPISSFSVTWMLAILVISAVYAMFRFHISVWNTIKNCLAGFVNVANGGVLGILLIIPGMFVLMFKFFFAAFVGYLTLMATITGFIFRHTVPALKAA